jgi:hypothetical protein
VHVRSEDPPINRNAIAFAGAHRLPHRKPHRLEHAKAIIDAVERRAISAIALDREDALRPYA